MFVLKKLKNLRKILTNAFYYGFMKSFTTDSKNTQLISIDNKGKPVYFDLIKPE